MKEGLKKDITDTIGNKIKSVDDIQLQTSIDTLKLLKIGEFNSIGRFVFKEKIAELTPKNIFDNYMSNKLFFRANSDYVVMRGIEDECINVFGGKYRFIELSPIVPIGLNSILGNIDTNKSIITLNNAEAMSEVTLPLTLAGLKIVKENENMGEFDMHVGTIERLIRNQKFDKEFYLPHFKIFGGVSIFKKNNIRGEIHIHIIDAIERSLMLFSSLKARGFDLSDIEIEFGNSDLLYDLLQSKFGVQRGDIVENIHSFRKEKGNIDILDYFGVSGAKIMENIEIQKGFFETHGIMKYYNIFKDIEENIIARIHESHPEVKYSFNLGRLGGVGHYRGTMFTIFAKNKMNERVDIVDGGLTDRGSRILGDNKIKTFVFAVGLELLGKGFTS